MSSLGVAGVMVPSAMAWSTPWPAWPTAPAMAPQLVDGGERAGHDLARARHVGPEAVAREAGGAGVEGLPTMRAISATSSARGVLVVVGPLAHHVVADRSVGDVAGDVGGVAAARR